VDTRVRIPLGTPPSKIRISVAPLAERRSPKPKVVSSKLTWGATFENFAQIAQLVEHSPEERGVKGSIPFLGTNVLLHALCVEFFRGFAKFGQRHRVLIPAFQGSNP
jgi:hypothetical protein